ncbi:MAG: HAD-IA family hydrolase [Pseudomonadota bacterium]
MTFERSVRLLIFDWDGTLMDSAAKISNCWMASAMDHKVPKPTDRAVRQLIGVSLERMAFELFPECNAIQRQQLTDRYVEHWIQHDKTEMPFFSNVADGLRALERAGFLICVATGKSRRGLERALQDCSFAKVFAYTRCADESRPKPDPQMLFDVLEFCGSEACESVMIGDTTYDLEMAHHAGVYAHGVGYGYHSDQQLAPLSDFPVFHDFKSLSQFWLDKSAALR